MIIGVFGIPGVGKTTLCNKVSEVLPDVQVYSASQLIKLFDGEISYNKLSRDKVNSNQIKLISVARELKERAPCSSYILDLHNIIETEFEDVYIPKWVFENLGLDRVVFLYKSPLEILMQRSLDQKERSFKTLEELEKLQLKALEYFREIFPNEIAKVLFLGSLTIGEATNVLYKEIESYLT